MGFFDAKKGGNRVSRKNHKRAYGTDIYKTWVRTGKLEEVLSFITECAKKLVIQTEDGSWLNFKDIENKDTFRIDDLRGSYAIGGVCFTFLYA